MKCRICWLVLLMCTVAAGQTAMLNAQESKETKKKEEKKIDPAGTWRWERENNNGETVKNRLMIDINEKKEIVATYYGLMDGLKSKKGAIKGDRLVLDFDVERNGYSFQVKYDAKIKDDKIAGTITLTSDQGSRDIPWEAKRSVELSDVVGIWSLKLETPSGELHEPTLKVVEKDGNYSAVYDGGDVGEFDAKDLKAKDNKFQFTLTGELGGNEFTAKCTTLPRGSKLTGGMELEIGGEAIEMKISGKRTKNEKK